NPTGTVYSPDVLLELADIFPDKWILVDEAFIQFLSDYEERTLVNTERIRRNLLVFHSLTKFYAIPGIRLGCVIGHPETIALLRKNKEPWTVNGIAEKTASLLIDCLDYEDQLKRLIEKEKKRFFTRLGQLEGLTLLGSSANFFLAQWTATTDLDDLLRILLSNGLHVRDCRNFRLMENNYFRFAIRRAADNEHLITQVTRSIKKLGK
ncbi:aminotransferase class I/II-fold pyridoxal phosphate-dependent enzyme, partial [bacterium]|nr:aminotransferase class I/II-fold pyridoxal phosphate-dependent enzyme [bacterium]